MIQSEIIESDQEEKFISDLNYFLEKLMPRQLIDIKFQTTLKANKIYYSALIIYQTE